MKRAPIFIALFFILILFQSSNTQDFIYLTPSKQLLSEYYKGYHTYEIPKDACYLEKILPANPNRNATIDYTDKIQLAINKHKVIVMPNFPVLVNINGLFIPSNSKIYFNKNSVLVFKGPATARLNDIVKIYNASNVKIYNANIVGSRKQKNDQKGEWSAGICILNSSNVEINSFQIKDTWGDGIFIGSEDGKVSNNIIIQNGFIDYARRDGISITSANNLEINSVFISNTFGTLPMAGIQIEPSLSEEVIKEVSIKNIYTYNNSIGIGINLQSFSIAKGLSKKVDIKIQNYSDEESNYSFGTSINDDCLLINPIGKITVTNAVWKNPRNDFYWRNSSKYDVKVNFEGIKKYKNNKLIIPNE